MAGRGGRCRRGGGLSHAPAEAGSETDPRAEELRRKLDESRPEEDEREVPAEPTIDQAEADPGVEDKREAVHERGRAAAEEMRGRSGK